MRTIRCSAHGVCLPKGERCLPRGGVCPEGVCQIPPWTEWQTRVKTLPCRNYVADGKYEQGFIMLLMNLPVQTMRVVSQSRTKFSFTRSPASRSIVNFGFLVIILNFYHVFSLCFFQHFDATKIWRHFHWQITDDLVPFFVGFFCCCCLKKLAKQGRPFPESRCIIPWKRGAPLHVVSLSESACCQKMFFTYALCLSGGFISESSFD